MAAKLETLCAAAHRHTPTSSRQRASFRPRLEALEGRVVLSATAIVQTNLVSDDIQFAPAQVQDSNLVNPWGLAASPTGAWWVANEGTLTSTLYDTSKPNVSVDPLVVNIPHDSPTGIVFNKATGFNISENGNQGPSTFLFANADGTISGWNPNVDPNHAIIGATKSGALYLGLAIATDAHAKTRLYAADFLNNKIDAYDQNFQLVTTLKGKFTDSQLPKNYHPFNIQTIGGKLYVEYAPADKVLAGKAGAGEGAVDVFSANGQLQQRLIRHGQLNQPWAIALAPSNFGSFSNDLLVGNFGDGHINAFNPTNGHFVGQLKDANHQPITITHLWGLEFGNGAAAGSKNTLYFTAGLSSHLAASDAPFHGLFGSLQVAPPPAKNAKPVNGPAGGLPYPTAASVTQLVADINYANSAGGDVTINLKPGTTFDLTSVNNTTDGGNGLPVVGGTKAVNLTILGNGDTIERVGSKALRFLDVSAGASLALDHVTLQGGWASGSYLTSFGGAVYNRGTLTVRNGSTLSANSAGSGGSIYNAGGTVTLSNNSNVSGIDNSGGTVTVSDCTLFGIGNSGGTVTVSNSTVYGITNASGTMTVSDSTVSGGSATSGGDIYNAGTLTVNSSTISGGNARWGGGIYNLGTVTINSSTLTGNTAIHADYPWSLGDGGGIYNSGGTVTISNSTISGNTGDAFVGSGGGIYNAGGTLTVENNSSITGNTAGDGADAFNLGVLYLDGTSTIGVLDGNSAVLI